MPSAQVAENLLHQAGIINNRDDAHRVLADRAAHRVHLPDPQNQVAGGGMGMQGGAVCHIRAISAEVSGRTSRRIAHSAFRIQRGARTGSMVRVYSSRNV